MGHRPEFSLTQLLYFVTIAETGNISEAAARLHASQSAVSAAIQRLERQLANQLLVRHHAKGVSLTPAGKLLIDDARTILRQANALNQYSSRLQDESGGRLDIASYYSITSFLMPRAISRVANCQPGLMVAVHDVHLPIDLLLDGTCELAVTYSITSSDETRFTELVTPALYALVAQSHPLADSRTASLADLSKYPVLMADVPSSTGIQKYVESAFIKAEVPMPRVVRTTGMEATRALAGAGLGFMLTHHRPPSMDTLGGSRIALVAITDDIPHLSIGVQMLRSTLPTQRARNFVTALRMTAQQLYAPANA
ncbi:LysR family transcriptional regulator [Streptomyces sp. MUM 136J]|nr:LysR family transcriptional regulator [Streptomyces sp. MUM 136J]MCH0569878.1 LysR family transcriptional regulator [Streptomyces sp. MUM 136J]